MRTRILLLAAALIGSLLPAAQAAAAPAVVRGSYGIALAAPELAGPTPSGALVEGFDLDDMPGFEGDEVSVFVAFDVFECVHDASLEAAVEVAQNLRTATASGATAGTCSDRGQIAVPFTATVDLAWQGTGRIVASHRRIEGEEEVCRITRLERRAVYTGTVTWASPDLAASGAGTVSGEGTLTVDRSVCRPT